YLDMHKIDVGDVPFTFILNIGAIHNMAKLLADFDDLMLCFNEDDRVGSILATSVEDQFVMDNMMQGKPKLTQSPPRFSAR
ncbi:hypothetical protein ACJX0J_029226, partial [Zea mays]